MPSSGNSGLDLLVRLICDSGTCLGTLLLHRPGVWRQFQVASHMKRTVRHIVQAGSQVVCVIQDEDSAEIVVLDFCVAAFAEEKGCPHG